MVMYQHTMDKNPYFTSRTEIGERFARQLSEYRFENTAILALSPGGVVIAIEIAKQLHSIAGLLLLKHVHVPGDIPIGIINDQGGFTYDDSISAAQISEFNIEYRNNIETNKMNAMHQLHTVGHENVMSPGYFKGRIVIVVSDFAKTGTSFHAALDFLKPVETKKIILASAVATYDALDIMKRLGDEVLSEHVTDKDFPSSHYFANNEIPQTKELIQMMEQIVLQW
jgi:predicted phosphoribosyltransferase